jgi:putative tryptophan/tyrosine transport system substrate-binding protein
MRRRQVLAAGSALTSILAARAGFGQTAAKPLRVGYATIAASEDAPAHKLLAGRFRELGYVEGKSLITESIFLAGRADGYASAMKTLVGRGADVLVALGPEVALEAALAASNSLPIVMAAFDFDPVARGYVKSLARPEGQITGVFIQQIELAVKRAQFAKQAFPDLKAAVVFWDEPSKDQWQAIERTARDLGVDVAGVALKGQPYDYEAALAGVPVSHRQVLLVPNSPVFFNDRVRLAELTLRHRLPSIFAWREWVAAGGLMSFGPSFAEVIRRLADYVDRIGRGAKPVDLPIEQPTRFELVINLKTAKAIGIDLPPTILARADELIE